MLLAIILLLAGLGILILGAEGLVRGASSLARKVGIAPLVVGLTVVAFGTSAPELIVNLISAYRGSADLAIGNVVGSNIANILLILGLAAAFYPLAVKKSTVWKEIPFALLAAALVLIFGNDAFFDGAAYNAITRTDGLALIAIFAIFMYYVFGIARMEKNHVEEVKTYSWSLSALLTVLGILGLFLGGKILVDNAIILARLAGLSESLIGLTVVAVGTSLPEMFTSIIAAWHKQDDIAVGNIIGSNIFNVFWILGLTGTMINMPFNTAVNVDALVALGATGLLFVFMFIGNRSKVDRWQGVILVALYVAYIIYLIMRG